MSENAAGGLFQHSLSKSRPCLADTSDAPAVDRHLLEAGLPPLWRHPLLQGLASLAIRSGREVRRIRAKGGHR